MNKYNNPRLLNAVVSGTGMKHPIQPHVVVGDVSNGFIRGDLMDANAIVDLVNSGDAIDQETIRQAVADVIGTAPENLDTLGEIVEALDAAVLDPNTEGSLANQISVINTTIEDNELTIAAALNDLNSRLLELVTRVDALDGGGDTPTQTQYYKYPTGVQETYFIFNKNTSKNANVIISDETNQRIVVNDSGKIESNSGGSPDNAYLIWMKNMFERNGISLETTEVESTDLGVNDIIPNWEEYMLLEKP